MTESETYPDGSALEAAMEADGLSACGGGRSGTGADGSHLRLGPSGTAPGDGAGRDPPGPSPWKLRIFRRRSRSAGGWRWWGSSDALLLGRAAGSLSGSRAEKAPGGA